MLVPLVAMTTLLAAAVGVWSAAMNVKYRDIRHALPFAIQILMFLTPIIYPVSFVPARWRGVLALNPLSGIIQGFRDAVFGRCFHWPTLGLSVSITVVLALVAVFIFGRMERGFADVI
jgi:lipopolysaccharide transport system permease protein